MIIEADREKLTALHTTDPFYTRILSLYESYGGGYDFVGYWVQETDGKTVSAISRFEDKFSLYLTEDSDLEEVAAFLRFQGAGAVMTDSRYTLELTSEQVINGQVLRYAGEYYNSESELYTPEIKSLYALLQSCESDIFRVPEYKTESAAILGAVATHPDFRRRGLSRELVKTLASQITSQGRAAYVFSASVANTRFYQNSGFEICADFTELIKPF